MLQVISINIFDHYNLITKILLISTSIKADTKTKFNMMVDTFRFIKNSSSLIFTLLTNAYISTSIKADSKTKFKMMVVTFRRLKNSASLIFT